MTSFKFPPPPPPPPKASSNDAQNDYSSQRGGSHRGRGDRGRGRGGPGRGRGNFQSNSKGAYSQAGGSTNARGGRGGYQHLGRGGPQYNSAPQSRSPHQFGQHALREPLEPPITASSHGTTFIPAASSGGTQAPPVDPAALAQAMAFMSTPAGLQTMAAFANHMTGGTAVPSSHQSSSNEQLPLQNHPSSPNESRKRKRDESQMQYGVPQKRQQAQSSQQQGAKPPRVKAAAPPPVPSFGFSLPSVPASQPLAPPKTNVRTQYRPKANLGLTQGVDEEPECSSDDDVDEEATFASNVKVEGVVFEHEGENISLQTPAEISAWIKDRRRRFPTKKRIAEKAQEAAAKRRNELDFLRKVTGKPTKQPTDDGSSLIKSPRQQRKGSSLKAPADLDVLRKKVQDSMTKKDTTQESQITTKPTSIDLGLGYESESGPEEDDNSVVSDSSVVSSSEESSNDSDSGSDANEDDTPPEAQSSKVTAAPKTHQRPPKPPATETKKAQPKVCNQWRQYGNCKYGKNCRYPHPLKDVPKPPSLYERMVEQELERADRLALDAIKYLGTHGFLG